jgi:hypothetical protein
MDLVADVVAELEEVRASERRLERDVVRDDRDGSRIVRTHERVRIGVVGDGVLADCRRLAMG